MRPCSMPLLARFSGARTSELMSAEASLRISILVTWAPSAGVGPADYSPAKASPTARSPAPGISCAGGTVTCFANCSIATASPSGTGRAARKPLSLRRRNVPQTTDPKQRPLSAPIFSGIGERVIWRTRDGKELHLYTTTIPTRYRFVSLMHNPQYRLSIAWLMVYNQPPHVGFYLGVGMTAPRRRDIALFDKNDEASSTP